MKFCILFFSFLFIVALFSKNLIVSGDIKARPICTLEDIRNRLKNHCGELILPPNDGTIRRRRHYTKSHFSLAEPKTQKIFRVRRSTVQAICCTPQLINKRGPNCIEFFNC